MTRRRAILHPFLLWTTLVLWSLAALIPPATMLAARNDGTVQMVLCSGTGTVSVTVPDPDAPATPPHHDTSPCPFAAAHMAVALVALPVLPQPPAMARIMGRVRIAAPILPPATPSRPQARGPPLLSA